MCSLKKASDQCGCALVLAIESRTILSTTENWSIAALETHPWIDLLLCMPSTMWKGLWVHTFFVSSNKTMEVQGRLSAGCLPTPVPWGMASLHMVLESRWLLAQFLTPTCPQVSLTEKKRGRTWCHSSAHQDHVTSGDRETTIVRDGQGAPLPTGARSCQVQL